MFDRRTCLKSATGILALPALNLFAQTPPVTAPPKRLIFLNFGWGVTEETWYPLQADIGRDYALPDGLAPLKRHKEDFSIIQGLWHRHCLYNDAGHSGSTFWLTGANRFAHPGVSFSNTISADQVASATFGRHTRFDSIQVNGHSGVSGDGHGPGLSLAWDAKGKPIGGQDHPVTLYRHLFSNKGGSVEQVRQQLKERRSVLDSLMLNAKQLQKRLGREDTTKLDEYFTSIRNLENRVAKEDKWLLDVPRPAPTVKEPSSVESGRDRINMMYDLMVAAIQTDSTRVMTFRQPVQSLLNSEEITVGGHDISHYHGNNEKRAASQRRDLIQSELFAGFLDRLKATKEADGSSLFDHTCVVYGSNLRTGHNLDNCPTIVAGASSGIKMGEHFVCPSGTPLNNLWLTILSQMGVTAKSHGDSTGVLEDLVG
ncbi:hypothetical protein SV7mr_29070 [Stieleria bergensis]|uniref:DUF1552 domain-containing protein n=1 Tax=Stieleria bergensis TaxID=2528025 RepID=A0A517SW78_9BACT|nr:hypothetical protein SV7mr_29070 [Planctomycetes bacterium SV_7m_r]